jgi:hypothetical protein
MKTSFFYITIGLVIGVIGVFSYQTGKHAGGTASILQEETNPILKVYATLSPKAQALYLKQSDNLTKEVPARLVELDSLNIGCFGAKKILNMSSADTNLGGQCCGHLKNDKSYDIQLEVLDLFIKENGGSEYIPENPYDTPVPLAQKLTKFDSDIILSATQQKTYDEATEMSHHGGPCCCKCWKWYVMSGLAKKLIVDEGWDAHQISELWDLSSSCGHDEDTNMHEHYNSPHDNDDGHHKDMMDTMHH